jgi:predicted transcriptional regulator
MSETVTFRLDPETARILRDLTRRRKQTKSAVIKDALRGEWKSGASESRTASGERGTIWPRRTSWEIYSQLYSKLGSAPPGPKRDRARNVSRLVRKILLAKRRAGTL